MKKKIICITLFWFLFISCKTNKTVNGSKKGIWIEEIILDSISYKSKGRFKNNEETGKWQYFENGIRVKKEIFKKSFTIKTLYHLNGKIASRGRTKTITTNKMLHWFYDGIWNIYDVKGKLIRIKIYKNSELISDKAIIDK